jgi:glycosyltransferase involved in cell wall biosynthesis
VGPTPELSIVLPCYNEADNLPPLIERYAQVWQDLPAELILVDNGSTDRTAEVLARELPTRPFARTVGVEKNRGYGHGIMTGLRAARGRFLAFSHADQQCKPDDIFAAYHALRSSPRPERAVVKGRRARRSLQAELVTASMGLLASAVLVMPLWDVNAQPKVFPRALLERLTAPPVGFAFDLYVLYKARQARMRLLTVPVVFGQRGHGQSKWAFSFLSRWRTMLGMAAYIFALRFGLAEGRGDDLHLAPGQHR